MLFQDLFVGEMRRWVESAGEPIEERATEGDGVLPKDL
jgi:hypothetical protein